MSPDRLADDIETAGSEERSVDVQISYDVIKLFSEQLYASPVKAIEELVVNSWDADATTCAVLVDLDGERPLIVVFDDGKGMNLSELENLWHIGVSAKVGAATARKQIGKFGIGKLASYAVARRTTYISKTNDGIYAVAINFEDFAEATDSTGATTPVTLTIRRLSNPISLETSRAFRAASRVLDINGGTVDLAATGHWTFVVLEDLKEKAHGLATGRLRWVLQTAMPLAHDFSLFLNGDRVDSSKEAYTRIIRFGVQDLDDSRLSDLSAVTGETWARISDGLTSPSFPSGVRGEVYVTDRSLYAVGGKSEDLGRSHGFFVRVHNRLINETDALFGARPLSFTTWYRFAAIVQADDLNEFVTAARDDVEQSEIKARLRELLIQLFNQARDQHEDEAKKRKRAEKEKKEGKRDDVPPDLVEKPLADALAGDAGADDDDTGSSGQDEDGPGEGETPGNRPPGSIFTSSWRMLEPIRNVSELQTLIDQLYSTERKDRSYRFRYSPGGVLAPLARLDPRSGTFTVNEDHDLVREYSDDPSSKRLLETVVVAEVLLEVYLRAADVELEVVAELLDRRDVLLRSLAQDETHSLPALAAALRSSVDQWQDLEVALVGALRALGFTARHIGGSKTPDGEANYMIHGVRNTSFTLEAKSSRDVPDLGQLDFAGLRSHYEAISAKGCLLVAPTYPAIDNPSSEVAIRSKQQGVSCWTVDQLALVVEAAERREINAPRLQEIVLEAFSPIDVKAKVQRLLSPTYDNVDLYRAILDAFVLLHPRLRTTPRNVSLVAGEVSRLDGFAAIDSPEVHEALLALARSSRGMLHVKEDQEVVVLGSIDELRRRLAHMTGEAASPRRRGTFRSSMGGAEAAEVDPSRATDSEV